MDHKPADSQFDEKLRMALQSIPVPSDLQSKLVAAVRSEASNNSDSSQELEAQTHYGQDQDLDLTVPSSTAKSPIINRRRLVRYTLAAAATICLATFSLQFLQKSFPSEQLADFTVDELERLDSDTRQWTPTPALPETLLAFVIQNLDTADLGVVGEKEVAQSKFGKQGKAWKLSDRRGDLFVFVFDKAPSVDKLSQQLRVIQFSGRWSLAAKQSGDQIVLVASKGDIRRYFKPNAFA